MFSFFTQDKSRKILSPNEIVDALEQENFSDNDGLTLIDTFSKDKRNRHGNTYVLQALAWNKLLAVKVLLALDKDKIALNIQDTWPTCLNTPLILAAKIDATEIIEKLVGLGADIDKQDYRGFTALHYACLLRNEKAIKVLLNAGASRHFKDAFGKLPITYYRMEITKDDLTYRYGIEDGFLCHVPDINNHYFSTQKKCLSALRWYIAHIIVNHQWGNEIKIGNQTIYDLACQRLAVRAPVNNAQVYHAMMKCFCNHRPSFHHDLMGELIPDKVFFNAYNDEKYDRYRLYTSDLLSPSAVHVENKNEIWVELQELDQYHCCKSASLR